MDKRKSNSGADAPTLEELSTLKFHKILDCTIEELLEKAWSEQWNIKHIEFWLKVKNAQNSEQVKNAILDRLESLDQPVIL
jgi:hypothetical protein